MKQKKLSRKGVAALIAGVCVAVAAVAAISVSMYFSISANKGMYLSAKSGVKNASECVMVAHRGFNCQAPENTMAAFREAREAGYEYAETDIQLTSDGIWVICHDDTVDRTTDGKGRVDELTFKQIRSFTVDKGAELKKYPNEKIPTLEEFLDYCQSSGLKPVIELKLQGDDVDFSQVVKMLEDRDLTDKAVIISFHLAQLKSFRALCPQVEMQFLCDNISEEVIAQAQSVGNCGLDIKYKDLEDRELIDKAKSMGMSLNSWTIDSEKKLNKVDDMGIDMITTNCFLPE